MKFSFLIPLFILFWQSIFAQNLVKNFSFEQSQALDCLSCNIHEDEFSKKMYPWNNLNTQTTICDCTYPKKANEGDYKFKEVCPKNVAAQDGCKMIQMKYMPQCMDWDHTTRGCASYLGSLLKEKLQMGKKYKISFWLYIPAPKDPDFEKHIGFTLFPKKIRNPVGAMIPQNVFQIDTIMYNQWYPVSWNIQPTCPLQYLVLGVFRGVEGPPVHNINRPGNNYYFIDNVVVKEITVKEETLLKDVSFFCKPELIPGLTVRAEVKGASVYFESGASKITIRYQPELDSFAIRARQNPKTTFTISGHTDNVGSDHLSLSQSRIDEVLSYLEIKHKIPKLRFIMLPKGISNPKNGNNSEADRQANRRVEIQQRDYKLEDVIYRNMLTYVFQNNIKQAYKALNIWLHVAPQKRKLLMLNDPRIGVLKNDPRWNNIQKRVRESYDIFPAGIHLSYSLDSLWAEDQKSRTLKYYIENLGTYIYAIDSLKTQWDVHFTINTTEQENTDQAHLEALKKLIGADKWVKQSEVGERAASGTFFIIQHSMDINLLESCLPLLKDCCLEGEAPWKYYAMMYDRLQVNKDLPQRYGTQYKVVGDQQELFPLENKTRVNEWRNEIGLPGL